MDEADEHDSITAALSVIGDRWSLLVLRGAFRGLRRFGELRDDLGIASNLLTDRLTRLVDHGVLDKVQYQDRPPRFEYRLSHAGMGLSPVLIAIMQWGDEFRRHDPAPTTSYYILKFAIRFLLHIILFTLSHNSPFLTLTTNNKLYEV